MPFPRGDRIPAPAPRDGDAVSPKVIGVAGAE
jgi:hypothetical protein